jgi:CheY-like chemotaxis protein
MSPVHLTTRPPERWVAGILIAEDERIVALDLRQRLIALGYNVVATVATGEDAVERAFALNPDLALIDVRLGGRLDGVDAVEIIKVAQDVPIIYMTAFTDDDTLNRAKRTNPFGYLVKPYNLSQLRCAIEIALHRHQSSPRAHLESSARLPMPDRRHPHSRERLLSRVRSEFQEMPGLILTVEQATRLFGIRKDICVRVFAELHREGLVDRLPGERYAARPRNRRQVG